MDLLLDPISLHQSSPNNNLNGTKNHDTKKEPDFLLDETWFFGNLLERKPRMLRCYSDPSPCPAASNTSNDNNMFPGESMEETFSSINRIPQGKRSLARAGTVVGLKITRTPSMPPSVTVVKQEEMELSAERNNDPRIQETRRDSLLRAPSLPIFADDDDDKEEIQDEEESDFSMGKLIRQASLNQSKVLTRQASLNQSKVLTRQASLNQSKVLTRQASLNQSKVLTRQASLNQSKVIVLPPRQIAKGVTRSCSISTIQKQNPRKKSSEPERINTNNTISSGCDSSGETKPRYATNQSKIRKSHSSIAIEQVQGFKNLGLNLHDEEKSIKKAHPSELWLTKKFSPPPQTGKKSAEDIKAQIKFWARAVASNVRQEC